MDTTLALLEKMGRVTIVMEKYVPGFVINRLQRILGREVLFLLEEGYVSAEDLDKAVKASLAPRMMVVGLVQRYDFTGLELSARNMADEKFFDPPVNPHPAPPGGSDQTRATPGPRPGKAFLIIGTAITKNCCDSGTAPCSR